MRRATLLAVIATFVLSACGSSDGLSNEDELATKVQEVIGMTQTADTSLATALSEALTATATNAVTSTPPPTSTPTVQPTATATPTPTSTATTIPPTPQPTATPTSEPTPSPTENPYVASGYVPFNRPEIDMMIHPRLSFDDSDSVAEDDFTLYRFADFNAEYLVFDIRVHKALSGGGRITHSLAQSVLTSIVDNTDSIQNLAFVATDDTSMRDRHGVIVRHTFTIDGRPGYGAFMLIDFGQWVYSFDAYGADYEYETVEDLLHAIFDTAYLRGPNEQV